MQRNRGIKGNNENLDANTLETVHKYYFKELRNIAKKRNTFSYEKVAINGAIARFRNQLNEINGQLTKNTSEVLVELQADNSTQGDFELSYSTAVQSYKKLGFSFGNKDKQVFVSKPIVVMPMENQTSLEIRLDTPFTIKSSGKQKVVSINNVDIPAYYEYRTVPKLEKAAFLIARVADWGEYNLLEGEANLYFESTYIGKSILDVRFLTDTLNISLGRDKNVLVNRQKVKSQTSREFIGKETIEKRHFDLSIRNSKGQPINIIV